MRGSMMGFKFLKIIFSCSQVSIFLNRTTWATFGVGFGIISCITLDFKSLLIHENVNSDDIKLYKPSESCFSNFGKIQSADSKKLI